MNLMKTKIKKNANDIAIKYTSLVFTALRPKGNILQFEKSHIGSGRARKGECGLWFSYSSFWARMSSIYFRTWGSNIKVVNSYFFSYLCSTLSVAHWWIRLNQKVSLRKNNVTSVRIHSVHWTHLVLISSPISPCKYHLNIKIQSIYKL